MKKGYREESKLTQEWLPAGKLSSYSKIKRNYLAIFPTNKLITIDASKGEVMSPLDESVTFIKGRQEFDQLAPCPQEGS